MTSASSISQLQIGLDAMFERPEGLYGTFEDLPVISQKGHDRRVELLESLHVGDITKQTVVDFGMGCWGFGSVYGKLHNCRRAIGMDISRSAIKMSLDLVEKTKPAYWEHFEAFQSDGMDIPLPDGTVDLFFAGESIEHVKFPPRFLAEIYRVLKDDGQLILTTPNRDAILYKEAGEEYCTSPEHFWLFNYEELEQAVLEFFDITVAHGFNGSFGSHEEDRVERDLIRATQWSREFETEPAKATGIILQARKKAGVSYHYDLIDVPTESIEIKNAETYLDLEFGLKGLLLDGAGAEVIVERPPSDGVVCRLWCHRWSGMALVSTGVAQETVDLYTFVPGWKNWVSSSPTFYPTKISICPAMAKNDKADAEQVIYFETFGWRRVANAGSDFDSQSKPTSVPSSLALAGYGYDRFKLFVGTTVFLWFTPTTGNLSGPWLPVDGRLNWTGTAEFWARQIREIMMANIDVIYLHCIDQYEPQRIEFFKAYAGLRARGWDVPKLAPFLDPYFLWRENPIDVGSTSGQDEFARHYIAFFQQYFSQNQDEHAASYLATIDGKLVLATWWVTYILKNLESFERMHVEVRLRTSMGDVIPQLENGIYVVSAALIDPDLKFSDERLVMFAGYAYAIHSVHNSVDAWHVQAGYWDQNIRTPGYFLPRDGGKNYRRAWDAVVSNMPNVHRVYIESWNEYDEGSGIYASMPAEPFRQDGMHENTDVFSDWNDPYEYINTTAEGAGKVNGRLELDAKILRYDIPTTAETGAILRIFVTVQNCGNKRWNRSANVDFIMSLDDEVPHSTPIHLAAMHAVDDIGVVRGQVCELKIDFVMPDVTGTKTLRMSMGQSGIRFGTIVAMDINTL